MPCGARQLPCMCSPRVHFYCAQGYSSRTLANSRNGLLGEGISAPQRSDVHLSDWSRPVGMSAAGVGGTRSPQEALKAPPSE